MEPRPRDLVLAQIGHRDTDPAPYTLGFEEEVGVQLDRHYRGSQWRSGIQPYLHSVQVVDPVFECTAISSPAATSRGSPTSL